MTRELTLIHDELSMVFGKEYARMLINLERKRAKDDPIKLAAGLKNLITKAGGKHFAEAIYARIYDRLGETP